MGKLLDSLQGGDLRSIGSANEAAAQVLREPSLAAALAEGLRATDPVVRMRCANALEKASRVRPALLQPYTAELRALLSTEQPKELLWHILQMLPRVPWPDQEVGELMACIQQCLLNPSSIVKACAMQAMADMALQHPSYLAPVLKRLRTLTASGTPAMRSRGAKLIKQLNKALPP